MGAEEKISVTLSEALSASVRKAVDSGPFASPDAVAAAALTYWQDQRERELGKLRDMIAEGLASGPSEPWERAETIKVMSLARRDARGG